MASRRFFTSESVSMGHPDKMCDQISDAVLDALLEQDPRSRIACETATTTGLVMVLGEVTTSAQVDLPALIRGVVADIGYTDSDMGFDAATCAVQVALGKQSPDISQGVTEGEGLHKEQGAGDQGMMFGYACDETPELMPAPIRWAHRLIESHRMHFESGELDYLRPDAKSQVTVQYDEDSRPSRIDVVVVSTQHSPEVAGCSISATRVAGVQQGVRCCSHKDIAGRKALGRGLPGGREDSAPRSRWGAPGQL